MSKFNQFKFVCTGGPYGDCSSHYKIELKQPCTMAQFVEFVNQRGEWGCVYINPINYFDALAKYRYDTHIKNKPLEMSQPYLNRRIARIEAHGGWSNMDYYVHLV
ncbi:MAG: hypothetical protein NC131_13185 [Roseburia sp.]|nr:hypothetical protein [Roseburia sp.]